MLVGDCDRMKIYSSVGGCEKDLRLTKLFFKWRRVVLNPKRFLQQGVNTSMNQLILLMTFLEGARTK